MAERSYLRVNAKALGAAGSNPAGDLFPHGVLINSTGPASPK